MEKLVAGSFSMIALIYDTVVRSSSEWMGLLTSLLQSLLRLLQSA